MKRQFLLVSCYLGLIGSSALAGELHVDVAGRDLRLTAATPNSTWTLGTTVTLEATLSNAGSSPLMVDTLGDLNEVYEGKKKTTILLSCWALSWQPSIAMEGSHRGKAPLEVGQFIRLEPGQTYQKRLSLALTNVAPGRYRVKLAYAPRVASSSFTFPEHWLRQHRITDPIWTGMVFSEPMDVEVVRQ